MKKKAAVAVFLLADNRQARTDSCEEAESPQLVSSLACCLEGGGA